MDDSVLLRDYLAMDLGGRGAFHVVGVCASHRSAIADSMRLSPAVVVFDVESPGPSLLEATRSIRSFSVRTRVLYLCTKLGEEMVRRAIACGVTGLVTKTHPREALVEAILAVADGRTYYSPDVPVPAGAGGSGWGAAAGVIESRASRLTNREWEVLRYLAEGSSFKSVASVMSISEGTVRKHTANLMKKLDLHKRAELTRFAIRENIIEP